MFMLIKRILDENICFENTKTFKITLTEISLLSD